MTFHKAVKYGAKLRMALSGPAGAGKTYTALTLATALADGQGVALIDTEHGSASKYADLFTFDTLCLETFHPQRYIEAIHEAEAAGYAVLVIDSLSHAWSGQGGLLEEKDKIARAKYSGNCISSQPCAPRWITCWRRARMGRRCRARSVWPLSSAMTSRTSSTCSARSRATIR